MLRFLQRSTGTPPHSVHFECAANAPRLSNTFNHAQLRCTTPRLPLSLKPFVSRRTGIDAIKPLSRDHT
jgi:hypothetical protein